MPAPILQPRRLLLVGMMGTGKTTVGRELARRTGWSFLDNDALVLRHTGRTARELQASGVDALRAAEAAALLKGLDEPPPAIVGAAAGVIERPDLRRAMRAAATVVWLRADPAVLVRRALPELDREDGAHRPWLAGGEDAALDWMRARDAERRPRYEDVADVIVDVAQDGMDRSVDAIVEEILAALTGPDGRTTRGTDRG